MEIKSANVISPKLVYNIEYKSYAFSPKEDIRNSLLGQLFNSIIGYNSEEKLLTGLKQVKVSYGEYMKRMEKENNELSFDLSTEEGYEELHRFHEEGNLRLTDIQSGYSWNNGEADGLTEENKYWLTYSWQSEIYFAQSYSDITYVYLRGRDNTTGKPEKEEYYSTPEVIEVLEKWKEALERWNNPEERQKMIEEYEKEHGKEK